MSSAMSLSVDMEALDGVNIAGCSGCKGVSGDAEDWAIGEDMNDSELLLKRRGGGGGNKGFLVSAVGLSATRSRANFLVVGSALDVLDGMGTLRNYAMRRFVGWVGTRRLCPLAVGSRCKRVKRRGLEQGVSDKN